MRALSLRGECGAVKDGCCRARARPQRSAGSAPCQCVQQQRLLMEEPCAGSVSRLPADSRGARAAHLGAGSGFSWPWLHEPAARAPGKGSGSALGTSPGAGGAPGGRGSCMQIRQQSKALTGVCLLLLLQHCYRFSWG